ncbi:MAG: HypC/HybG/HupF family hydrogenase formation chaperone [archaeon]
MCYAIPAKVLEVDGEDAVVDYGGVKKKVNVSLLDVATGDYVLIHAGFAIEKVDEMSAKEAIDAVNSYVNEVERRS